MAMVGEETKQYLVWRWKNLVFCHIAVLVFLATLTSPVAGDIIVIDIETNQTADVFRDMTAAFGPNFPRHGLSARVVYAKPAEACEPVQPPPGPREGDIGWILVIARGGHCGPADKVLAAQRKGYDGVIVHNFHGIEALAKMYGNQNKSFINIPSTFVGWREGMSLKQRFNFTSQYYVKILEEDDINYRMYLWPFAIVVAICFVVVMVFVIVMFVREHTNRRGRRISKKHLKKIPVRKYKKGDYYDTCAICLDEYEEGEKIRVLPCDHVYHTKCIDPWLTKNKKTCPVCKRRVMPGRDGDESESDQEGATINSSERTRLLTESSGGGSSSSATQYFSTTVPSLHAPGHGDGEDSLSHSPTSSLLTCSIHSTTAHVSAKAFLSPARQGRSPLPTDLDGSQGAVGGAGISEQFVDFSDETDVSPWLQQDQGREKRSRRAEETDRLDDTAAGENRAEGTTTETREERRERRRRKKEKKRRELELSRRAGLAAAPDTENSDQPKTEAVVAVSDDVAEEIAKDPEPEASGTLSVEGLPTAAGSIQEGESKDVEEERHESYINPSYSESAEVVLHNPGYRHELNDML